MDKEALKLEESSLRVESEKLAPLEQELDAIKLAHLQAVTESDTHKEQYEAERQKLINAESSLQDMSARLAEVISPHLSSPSLIRRFIYATLVQPNMCWP